MIMINFTILSNHSKSLFWSVETISHNILQFKKKSKQFIAHNITHVEPLIPCFGLLVMSALGFKARVDFALARFLACAHYYFWTKIYTRNLPTASHR